MQLLPNLQNVSIAKDLIQHSIPAFSKQCPKYKQEQQIITLKCALNICFPEARGFFNFFILERVLGIVSLAILMSVNKLVYCGYVVVCSSLLFKVFSHSLVSLDQSALLILQNCGS